MTAEERARVFLAMTREQQEVADHVAREASERVEEENAALREDIAYLRAKWERKTGQSEMWDDLQASRAAEQAARKDAFREAAQWCDERARKFAKAMDETKDRPSRMMYVSGKYADIGHEFEYAAEAIRALAASDGNNQPDAPKGDTR